MPAGLYPALDQRVHPRDVDAGGDDFHSGIGQQGVEGGGELRVPVADQVPGPAARVLEIHEEVASELYDPLAGGVRGGAQDPDTSGRVLDDGEDVQLRARQGADFEQVAGQQGLGLVAQEVGLGGVLPFRCGRDAVFLEDLPGGGRGDLDAQCREFAVDFAVAPGRVFAGEAQDQGTDRADRGGRPRRLGTRVAAWRRLSRSRCQRRIVSGRTSSRRWRSLSLGRWWSRLARTARSVSVKFGFRTWRWRTSSWCRSARISMSLSLSLMGRRRRNARALVAAR